MQLYAITDRHRVSRALPSLAKEWSLGGVRFVQLREKDLDRRELAKLTGEMAHSIDRARSKLLVNVPNADFAAAVLDAGADGVHLAGKPVLGCVVRVRVRHPESLISLPCHNLEDIAVATAEEANLVVFSPVFEKLIEGPSGPQSLAPQGVSGLRRACDAARKLPVFALGGVSVGNAAACVEAGATGVAAIRLFAEGDWRRLAYDPSPRNHI
jgi:thiamine-phosphate pyrophosphorylase